MVYEEPEAFFMEIFYVFKLFIDHGLGSIKYIRKVSLYISMKVEGRLVTDVKEHSQLFNNYNKRVAETLLI